MIELITSPVPPSLLSPHYVSPIFICIPLSTPCTAWFALLPLRLSGRYLFTLAGMKFIEKEKDPKWGTGMEVRRQLMREYE